MRAHQAISNMQSLQKSGAFYFINKSDHCGGFSLSHFMFCAKCAGSLAERNKLRPFIHSGSTIALAWRCIGMCRTLAWRTPSICNISGCSFYDTYIQTCRK